ncbi:hypothetical protein N7512_004989 [Penicillium capsulatum]|nr:hypothetical protein N7512_004989 [Penicillium capsulatum]
MDHVSTLCALSTVGIASTGLALGRVERSKNRILRRKTLSHNQPLLSTPIDSTPVDARPRTSLSARPTPAAVDWTYNTDGNESPRGLPSQDIYLRRASLSFGARRRRRGQTLTNPPLRIPENEATTDSHSRPHSRRPSTGWLRRLSIVSFQSDSPSTNSPVTPSFSGSASPVLPRPPSQRRSPNKLIKRASSQQSNNLPFSVNTSVPPAGLRRPATSYQRPESGQWQSPFAGDTESRFSEPVSVDSPTVNEFEIHSQLHWEPYLLPKSEAFSEKMARKIPTPGSPKVQGVRRIVYERDTAPALVLASTVTTRSAVSDHPAIPTTPVDFQNPFRVDNPPPAPAPVPAPERPAHKHSFSLNDVEPKRMVVNTVSASGAPILGRPRGGSLKRVKGRTFSIPRSELSEPESAPSISSAQLQRRNLTDPVVFRRPQPVSPALAPSGFGPGSRAAPRSVSQDYNIGLRRPRPLTPDAVALSAWQHSCRPGSYAYTSLRRRPKRHSIAASDPSSTVIGSDDTRVFTSADEYETDAMTDYWDSIRTRETSGSELKGLRIETMFDKAGAQLSNEEVTTLEDLLPRGSFASRMEKDASLFPLAQVRLNDTMSICEEDEERRSMGGILSGQLDGSPHQSPVASSAQKANENDLETSFANLSPPVSPIDESRAGQKMNIFDWSEQTRTDRDMSDSEARPRTVHGKQNGVDRGSRAACRKVPSTIHLRSQSVPVARDAPASDSRQTSGKFGTWGLGSKGVSEDWDSDFDFDDGEEAPASVNSKTTEGDAGTQSMTVPKAILERQASLRGQFGQVQELTLLVEELKRLRHQASVLGLADGPSSELWKEAEGIVNLATIDEEDRRSPPGSPSSLTFSFDDSDEDERNAASKRDSDGSWQVASPPGDQLLSPRQAPESNEDLWHSPSHSPAVKQLSTDTPKSKSVLDILQSGERPENSTLPGLTPAPRTQKLPFDTQSLRDLVVRAGVITRALKEVIRKAEGVDPSPQDAFPADPPFRRIFDQPSHDDFASFEAALAEMS